jgi:hypothetical protein
MQVMSDAETGEYGNNSSLWSLASSPGCKSVTLSSSPIKGKEASPDNADRIIRTLLTR